MKLLAPAAALGSVSARTVFFAPILTALVVSISALPGAAGAQEPAAVGSDFQVNEYTNDLQLYPGVAADDSGNFTVVWLSVGDSVDTSGSSIQARNFAPDGSPQGPQFLVNSSTTGDQYRASVARSDAGFIVVWSGDPRVSAREIHGQRFAPDGTAVGAQFRVNNTTANDQSAPDVAIDSSGGFVVVWDSARNAGDRDIRGRRFESDGDPIGNDFRVPTSSAGEQFGAAVEISEESGDFWVAWSRQDGSGWDVRARRFAADGSPLGSQLSLETRGDEFLANVDLAVDANGDVIAVWESTVSLGGGDFDTSIQGRRFASDGSLLGDQFQVDAPAALSHFDPSIATNGSDFLVVWSTGEGAGGDGSSTSIRGRRLDASGAVLGAEIQVNAYTTSVQDQPVVAFDGSGDFLATWQSRGSFGTDTSEESIQVRRLVVFGDIGDRVWLDENENGIQDDGEVGVAGVELDLVDLDNEVVATTETDLDGLYAFEDVPTGEYSLRVTAPPTFVFSPQDAGGDDAVDSDVDASGESDFFRVEAGVTNLDIDVGGNFVLLGDRVWRDLDANGIQDGGEPGVGGVTVTLFEADGSEVDQMQTDPDGRFGFSVLSGNYYLQIAAPPGLGFTARDAGSDDAADSDVNATGATSVIALGGIDTSWDAGLVPVLGSIGDRVWLDANLNGVQDGGELGFEGVTVELFTAGGVSQGTVETAVDGSYLFSDLPAGSYYLGFSEPAGFCYTAQDQGGDDALDSDPNPTTFTTPVFTLAAGSHDTSRDAGLVPDASVGNRVWLDDGNGIQDGGEPGIEGVTVRLFDALGTELDATFTDADGFFAFSPGPSSYYLGFTAPDDMVFTLRDQGADDGADSDVAPDLGTTTVFTLGPGQVDTGRDAGLAWSILGDRVWLDSNADGLQQDGEQGLSGITVRLLDEADVEVASTVTAADGFYAFVNLEEGIYRLEVVPPVDSAFSTRDVGSDDSVDSDVDPAGRTDLFAFANDFGSRNWDAGLILLPIFADGFEGGDTSAWDAVIMP